MFEEVNSAAKRRKTSFEHQTQQQLEKSPLE